MVSTATSGLRLSMRAFAASTRYDEKRMVVSYAGRRGPGDKIITVRDSNETHFLPNVFIPEEEPDAEVLCSYILAVPDDQLADSSKHNILDRLRRDATQFDHKDRGVSHPSPYANKFVTRGGSGMYTEGVSGLEPGWRTKARSDEPLLGLQAPQTDLAIIKGCFA